MAIQQQVLLKSILYGILMSSVFGCGESNQSKYEAQINEHPQKRVQAPQNTEDVGTIVTDLKAQDVVELLEEAPNTKVRVISHTHGIYEFFGTSQKELKNIWKDKNVYQNSFFETYSNDRKKVNNSDVFRLEANENQPTTSGEKLSKCVEDINSPQAVITVENSTNMISPELMNIGGMIKLTALKSLANPKHDSKLKYGWLVQFPTGATKGQNGPEIYFADSVELNPDALGYYGVLLVAQDERSVCATTGFEFSVTGNKQYVGNQIPVDEILKTVDINIFDHLADFNAFKAQELSEKKGEGVLVAVIDSGVNYNHAALLKNIWTNDLEIPDNGIDEDKNGLVDDYVGYDFVNSDGYPYDDDGHGSHVAGLIGSSYFGVAPKSKILPIKSIGPRGGDIASIVGGIYYAIDKGAKIINMSFGNYGSPHPLLIQALDSAEANDVLVIAASGNGDPQTHKGINTDLIPNFPSALPHDNIVAVAAFSKTQYLSSYSNYGKRTVDVVGPGGDSPNEMIVSTFMDNPAQIAFIGMSGTSMATPNVSGVAALIMSANPNITVEQIKNSLIFGGQKVDELKDKVLSGRRLDASLAVKLAQRFSNKRKLFLTKNK